MLAFNDFARVTVNSLNPAWTAPVALVAANTIDWYVPPPSGTSLTTAANRKTGGGSLITPSIVGSDTGTNNAASGNFTWSDGNNAQTNAGSHYCGTQTIGNGFRITVPAAKWPDWQILRVWLVMATPAQMRYTASIDDSDGIADSEIIGGDPTIDGDYGDNDAYKAQGAFVIDVRFASDKAGKTLTLNMLRVGTSMGYLILSGAAIYRGAPAPYSAQSCLLSPVGTR